MIAEVDGEAGGRAGAPLAALLALAATGIGAMALWHWSDRAADRAEMARLLALQPAEPPAFDPAMVAGLPEPARRFLTWAILPGTPLRSVARIEMAGRFSMGDARDAQDYKMTATQVLAAPEGFVWAMRAGRGEMMLSGSDSARWTRFWLTGLVPVARMGGDDDHRRSAFGRYVAEAVFWTPAAVLPGPGVTWDAAGPDTARMTMTLGELSQAVDIVLDAAGRPLEVAFQRWSNENADRVFRWQPFGGVLSDHREVDGFRVPLRVEAGNHFGTEDYFPFFDVRVTSIVWPER
ncbi:MAG: DUF6544 family protein [Pseudomonadota bacterium]